MRIPFNYCFESVIPSPHRVLTFIAFCSWYCGLVCVCVCLKPLMSLARHPEHLQQFLLSNHLFMWLKCNQDKVNNWRSPMKMFWVSLRSIIRRRHQNNTSPWLIIPLMTKSNDRTFPEMTCCLFIVDRIAELPSIQKYNKSNIGTLPCAEITPAPQRMNPCPVPHCWDISRACYLVSKQMDLLLLRQVLADS